MATTPRRSTRRRASNPETPPSQKQRLDGLLRDGLWYCNCEPRQLAARYRVSSEKPTKGQYFYRCRSPGGCNFFLWEAKAHLREAGLSGAQTDEQDEELPPRPRIPIFQQRQLMSYGIQVTPRRHLSEDEGGPSRTVDTPCPTGSKRKRDALEDSGDDSFGALDSDDEREMVALADTAGSRSKTNPKTPTTSRNIDTVTGLPTPSTTRTLFPDAASRSNKRHKTVSVEETPDTPSRAPTTTLSTTAPPSSPIPSSPSTNDAVHNPTDEVMALLRPHNLGASVLQSVRSVLATSVRRTRGLALGRDSARTAAREKDARIARLQERVAALENKDRMMNSQITNMKAGIMKLYQDN